MMTFSIRRKLYRWVLQINQLIISTLWLLLLLLLKKHKLLPN